MFRPLALFVLAIVMASPAAACRLPAGAQALTQETLAAINAERQAKRLAPLALDARLQDAAQSHACDSATRNRMGHDGSDGSDLGDRAARAGYDFREIAENVAQGYPSAQSVTQGWMNSPGHRRNILMRGARDAGLGIAIGGDGDLHWVLKLGRE
ncbi:MAG: CAP domain-containing protein [Rhodobacteraceae bacterium]|nr:CAP domain-containing protein [Paracoccaceae bacterium]